MTYDLMMEIKDITKGKAVPELLGNYRDLSDNRDAKFRRDSFTNLVTK